MHQWVLSHKVQIFMAQFSRTSVAPEVKDSIKMWNNNCDNNYEHLFQGVDSENIRNHYNIHVWRVVSTNAASFRTHLGVIAPGLYKCTLHSFLRNRTTHCVQFKRPWNRTEALLIPEARAATLSSTSRLIIWIILNKLGKGGGLGVLQFCNTLTSEVEDNLPVFPNKPFHCHLFRSFAETGRSSIGRYRPE